MRDDWNDLQAESSSIQWWRTFQEIWLQKLFENLRIWPLCESKPDGKPAVPGELLRHISGFNRVLTELVAYRNVIWTIAADIFFCPQVYAVRAVLNILMINVDDTSVLHSAHSSFSYDV